ncbi:MAG: diacylglycerol kinase family protein [Clostridiales bacterium]|nr:diacylglycerol kinase family protein [Clostridiales bacterium]
MKSFYYAFRGIVAVIKNEHNMRIHLCFCFYVILAGFVTGISDLQWAIVLLCMALVMGLECINTGLEKLCDAFCPEKSKTVGFAKDAAAGSVLIAAVFSAAVGIMIFFKEDKLSAALKFLKEKPLWSALILLTLIPLGIFALRGRRKKK